MRRFGRVVALLALTVPAAINVRVRAQSAADFAQTAAYAAAHQNADGGFAASPGQPSTLGATNTGLRVLDYVGGSLLDEPGCIRFVNSCKVPGGGFSQRPGGKPDVVTTALGLMAAAEVKVADKALIDAAVAYFRANTKAIEEVRMSIAGLEAVGARSPDFPRWAEQLEALRTPGWIVRAAPRQGVCHRRRGRGHPAHGHEPREARCGHRHDQGRASGPTELGPRTTALPT